jgi:hypothetical protein
MAKRPAALPAVWLVDFRNFRVAPVFTWADAVKEETPSWN